MASKKDELILIDTNILVYAYAATEEDAKKQTDVSKLSVKIRKARDLLLSALEGEFRACVASQNIAEFYSVVTSHIRKPIETGHATNLAHALAASTVLLTVYETKESFGEIFTWIQAGKRDPEAGAWIHDCRLAFTAKANGIRTILTENVSDFADFEFIQAINPLDPDYEWPLPAKGPT